MNKIFFIFLFFINAELVNSNELSDLQVNIKAEKIRDNFEKCSYLYYKIFNKKLLFQDYRECLLSNLDDLDNIHKYLIFNELFFQNFNVNLSKEDLKKYLLFVSDKNNFDNELKNFKILLEILTVYAKEQKELSKNDFYILLNLINFLDDKRDEIINFYIKLNNKKILKIKEILNNDQNFLNIFKIIIRWNCDLDSSWINPSFLEDLLISENYFNKNNKVLSYLEFETIQNKKKALNLSITQILLAEEKLYQTSDDHNSKIDNERQKKEIVKDKNQKKTNQINVDRDPKQGKKKISVINLETENSKKEYIIESSKNDRLIIKIKNTSSEDHKNEKIDQKDQRNKKTKKDNIKNFSKNQKGLLKGSFVIGVLFILLI